MCVMRPTVPSTTDNFRVTDQAGITSVVEKFFSAFVSGPDAATHVGVLREVLLPEAIVVSTVGVAPVTYTVDSFIRPRVELLTNDGLEDFREWPVTIRIDVFGDIAHAWCTYEKSWRQHNASHRSGGTKTIQLVRTDEGWRISAVAWDDEPIDPAQPAESVRPWS